MLKTIALVFATIVSYWLIGVVVSVVDTEVRDWFNNHPQWSINMPVNIKPARVAAFWIIYIPLTVLLLPWWLFTTGATAAHKFIHRLLHKPE